MGSRTSGGWQRACANTDCIEVTRTTTHVQLRDSTRPAATITVTPPVFAAFAAGIKAGNLDDFIAALQPEGTT